MKMNSLFFFLLFWQVFNVLLYLIIRFAGTVKLASMFISNIKKLWLNTLDKRVSYYNNKLKLYLNVLDVVIELRCLKYTYAVSLKVLAIFFHAILWNICMKDSLSLHFIMSPIITFPNLMQRNKYWGMIPIDLNVIRMDVLTHALSHT